MMKLFGRRKQAGPNLSSEGLTLRAEDGRTLYSFNPHVIASLRHMITERTYQEGLPARLAMVAALHGEGVSYTAVALATTLATDMDVKVCLVELNWWHPDLVRMLSLDQAGDQGARAGLADVLDNTASLDEALVATDRPNLTLLPAGELPLARRHSLARSSALRETIDELSQRYDHLIFDLPALLASSDAIALAALSEACCLVVRQGVTRVGSVKQALDNVKNMRVIGVILNQSSFYTPRWILNLIPQ